MESDMTRSESEEDRDGGERRLPPERWEIIKSQTCARAHELRAQMLREFGRWLVRRSGEMVRRFLAWHQRRSAVRELQGLDNRTLRDMGIARSEIEYLVGGGDPERRVPRKAVAQRVPCAPPVAGTSRTATVDRRAA
jgi:uncharacterized protein YjiS (DUF1127 family)